MGDSKQFLDEMVPRIHKAETAEHNGDAGPRFEMWAHTDPVSVFGAAFNPIGWAEVRPMFEKIASNFSNCRSCEWEVVAADVGEEFAYVLAIERTTASVGGSEPTSYMPAARRSSGAKTATGKSCIAMQIPSTSPQSCSRVCTAPNKATAPTALRGHLTWRIESPQTALSSVRSGRSTRATRTEMSWSP